MNDYEQHTITKIENINIFQNIREPEYNTCVIIFRDENYKPFLLYIEKMNQEMQLTSATEWLPRMMFPTGKDFGLETKIYPSDDNSVFRIVDLSFAPKEKKALTREEIETLLGYEIEIV